MASRQSLFFHVSLSFSVSVPSDLVLLQIPLCIPHLVNHCSLLSSSPPPPFHRVTVDTWHLETSCSSPTTCWRSADRRLALKEPTGLFRPGRAGLCFLGGFVCQSLFQPKHCWVQSRREMYLSCDHLWKKTPHVWNVNLYVPTESKHISEWVVWGPSWRIQKPEQLLVNMPDLEKPM